MDTIVFMKVETHILTITDVLYDGPVQVLHVADDQVHQQVGYLLSSVCGVQLPAVLQGGVWNVWRLNNQLHIPSYRRIELSVVILLIFCDCNFFFSTNRNKKED